MSAIIVETSGGTYAVEELDGGRMSLELKEHAVRGIMSRSEMARLVSAMLTELARDGAGHGSFKSALGHIGIGVAAAESSENIDIQEVARNLVAQEFFEQDFNELDEAQAVVDEVIKLRDASGNYHVGNHVKLAGGHWLVTAVDRDTLTLCAANKPESKRFDVSMRNVVKAKASCVV